MQMTAVNFINTLYSTVALIQVCNERNRNKNFAKIRACSIRLYESFLFGFGTGLTKNLNISQSTKNFYQLISFSASS